MIMCFMYFSLYANYVLCCHYLCILVLMQVMQHKFLCILVLCKLCIMCCLCILVNPPGGREYGVPGPLPGPMSIRKPRRRLLAEA